MLKPAIAARFLQDSQEARLLDFYTLTNLLPSSWQRPVCVLFLESLI